MGQPNREELLRMAIRSAEQGNRQGARMMFTQVLREDQRNERAMMWMAKLAESKEDRTEWLQRVLKVNPNNEIARDALAKMQYSKSARDNRVLLIFGVTAGVMIVLALIVLVVILTRT
jgi:Tfp pilus assembly protein PilF